METKSELEKSETVKVDPPKFDAKAELEKERAKLPSVKDLQAQIDEAKAKQQELEKLQDLKLNYGPGKPGTKRHYLDPLPQGLGEVRINEKVMVGWKDLTYEEFRNWQSIYDGRLDHERKSRLGEGSVADRELMMLGGGVINTRITDEQAKF